MKKLMIIWGVIAVTLVGTLTFIGYRFSKSIEKYHILESDMVEATDAYRQKYEIDIKVNDKLKLPLTKLQEDNFINSDTIQENDCDGYVLVTRKLNGYTFNAYIKCADYTTDGYENN